ncbi:MAG TPA: SCO family protein, partial [Sphingomicrobium sp.]|nr:SCO family protein [Sphingomicrobium sp.]
FERAMTMQPVRIILWALVALALAAFAFLMLRPVNEMPTQQQPLAISSIGGPFTLTGSDGEPFSSTELAGKPYAIFFGFTNCPDVCPLTLGRMVKLRKELQSGDRPFEILFVTVDPERDGPADVGKYAELFNSPVTGLTGSPAQIDQVKKQFGIFSQKVPDSSRGYSVDHTATVLLFDRNGDFSGTISPEEGNKAALAKLKRITA